MANEEHLAILKQGMAIWNRWRRENPGIKPDLSGADLSRMDLGGNLLVRINLSMTNLIGVDFMRTTLARADLRETDLTKSNLIQADLYSADLTRANLSNANLSWANLSKADLTFSNLSGAGLGGAKLIDTKLIGATLIGANLSWADLSWARLTGANLTQAVVGWTIFGFVDLSRVSGLEDVEHIGPSTIGIETVYLSRGSIPGVFLIKAGVPEDFFTYMDSLVRKPIQFFSCFISYSGKNKLFCDRLFADLQAKGVRTWYFAEDAQWGETVWGEIDRSIRIYDKLVVVCSKNSLQSGPVLREIERGLQREDKEHKNVLFPITIDDYIFEEWEHERKPDVLNKVVGDFRGWNRSAAKYEEQFKKLLKGLRTEEQEALFGEVAEIATRNPRSQEEVERDVKKAVRAVRKRKE